MESIDFSFKSNKSEGKAAKTNVKSSTKKTYTHTQEVTISNWHDAVGIYVSDEFQATVYEKRGYGIMVRFIHNGKEYKGLVHNKNMSHGKIQDSTDLFSYGEKVWVIVLGFDENERIMLRLKYPIKGKVLATKHQIEVGTSIYQEGQDMPVRLFANDKERQNLIVVTKDKNMMLCDVPYKEISWTNDTSFQEQQDFKVRIKRIYANNNGYKIICSIRDLKKNPWEKAIYTKGQKLSAIIDSYTEKGIKIITDDKNNLPGIIWKDQVTWLKNDNEVTKEDYPKLNSKTVVSVLKFAPEKQFLSCSIRELQENPWLHIKIGDTVEGYIYTKSDSNVVHLKDDIECECHDRIKLEPYKNHKFIVTDIDIQKKKVEVSAELLQRGDYYAKIAMDFFKQRKSLLHIVKWKNESEQTTYVLLPQNILFKGESIALPYLGQCISFLESNTPLYYREIMHSGQDSSVTFVSVDMADNGFTMPTIDISKMQRKELCAKVIFETRNYSIVNTIGVLGYFEKPEHSNIKQDEVKVMFAYEQDNPMQLYKFNLIHENKENESIKEFLTEEEKKVIDEKDMALINSLQEDMPGITVKSSMKKSA